MKEIKIVKVRRKERGEDVQVVWGKRNLPDTRTELLALRRDSLTPWNLLMDWPPPPPQAPPFVALTALYCFCC